MLALIYGFNTDISNVKNQGCTTSGLPRDLIKIDAAINSITHQLLAAGEREVSSSTIGNLVMKELLALDHVAYIRFASVYLDFTDVNAFRDAIEKIEKTKTVKRSR